MSNTETAAAWLATCIERGMPTAFALKSLELHFLNECKANRKIYL